MNSRQLGEAIEEGVKPIFTCETERCLWFAGTGEWDKAHDIVESLPEPGASWIHGMLHREEGDRANASYWYTRAKQEMPRKGTSFKDEWLVVAKGLLDYNVTKN